MSPSSCCREKCALRRKEEQLGCDFNPLFPETASVSDLSQDGNSVTHLYHITSHHYTHLQGQTCSLSPSLPSPAFKVLYVKHLSSASCLQESFRSRRVWEDWRDVDCVTPTSTEPPMYGSSILSGSAFYLNMTRGLTPLPKLLSPLSFIFLKKTQQQRSKRLCLARELLFAGVQSAPRARDSPVGLILSELEKT